MNNGAWNTFVEDAKTESIIVINACIKDASIKKSCIERYAKSACTKETYIEGICIEDISSIRDTYTWGIYIVNIFVRDACTKNACARNTCAKDVYTRDASTYNNFACIGDDFAEDV